MSTYLELCQDAARESGTVPGAAAGTKPTAVTSQTGRLANIVHWVQRAWVDIQLKSDNWKWMQTDFSNALVASTQRYAASALGISSRFADWVVMNEDGNWTFSVYLASEGQGTETTIEFVDWEVFKARYLFGGYADDTGKPQVMSVDEAQQVVLYPIPDDAYTLRGVYLKAPQELAADGDTPEMPTRYHDAIVWGALLKLANFDEEPTRYPFWRNEYKQIMGELTEREQPRIKMDEGLI